jgi:hypothetical protein
MMRTPSTCRSGLSRLLPHGAALACALALGLGTDAQAQDVAPPNPLKFGVMVDLGVPDGIGASGVVRPLPWVRAHLGLVTNTISLGVRGGVSLLPLSTFVSPSLNLDAGHYFGGDYNALIERFGGTGGTSLIRDVSYDYASASLGLNVGPQESWSIFLNLGLSYWGFSVDNFQDFLQESAGDGDITATPLKLRFTSPSLKLGFLYYF